MCNNTNNINSSRLVSYHLPVIARRETPIPPHSHTVFMYMNGSHHCPFFVFCSFLFPVKCIKCLKYSFY